MEPLKSAETREPSARTRAVKRCRSSASYIRSCCGCYTTCNCCSSGSCFKFLNTVVVEVYLIILSRINQLFIISSITNTKYIGLYY